MYIKSCYLDEYKRKWDFFDADPLSLWQSKSFQIAALHLITPKRKIMKFSDMVSFLYLRSFLSLGPFRADQKLTMGVIRI